MMRTPICDLLGIDVPIFAFSHCRDVVAAVSRAGGLGVLGALAFSPAELEVELQWIEKHVDGRPYGVDIVMPVSLAAGAKQPNVDKATLAQMIPPGHHKFVDELLRRFEVPALPEGETVETLLGWTPSGGSSHADVALAHDIRLLASALGPPSPEIIARAKAKGVKVAALVGTVQQAKKDVAAGVDIIVAQGTEAGGHTGEIGSMVLWPDVVDAVAPVPVLAAGGIATGRQIAAALALGAQGAWTGSLWLAVKEADVSQVVRDKIVAAASTDTVRSRALTGKPARQLRTAWTEAWDGEGSPGALPMPLQFMLTAEAQTRMHRYAHTDGSRARELVGTPIGQVVGRLNEIRSVKDVMFRLVEEYEEAVSRVKVWSGDEG